MTEQLIHTHTPIKKKKKQVVFGDICRAQVTPYT